MTLKSDLHHRIWERAVEAALWPMLSDAPLISLKEPIPKIRFMLSRHIRQLICAKEIGQQDQIIKTLKIVPFVARNLINQAKYFQMDELIKLYYACSASDYAVKTGKMDDRLSLETLLVRSGKKKMNVHV